MSKNAQIRMWASRGGALAAGVLLLTAAAARAGHNDYPSFMKVTNVKVLPRDEKSAIVSFDISWRTSWRDELNHDAAWVFFKVQAEGSTEWQPVRLVANKVLNPAGYGQESGTRLDFLVPDDADGPVGMFVRRGEYGFGTLCATNVTAVWDFTANPGVTKDVKVSMRGYGIEMVYIPEGAFYLGTGELLPYRLYQYTDGSQHSKPYHVTSEDAIPTGQQPGKLWARHGAQPEDKGELSAAFPKGYAAFYCMKAQIKCGQYAGFLNALPLEQAAKHVPEDRAAESKKVGFKGFAFADVDLVHNYGPVSWADGIAYAAWAGIRPMSELEYVKIGRGVLDPTTATGDTTDHPSCWGVADWTGWRTSPDWAVTIGNVKGRSFKGTNGRGTLLPPADWPQDDAVGAGLHGRSGPIKGHPSCREEAAIAVPARLPYVGWRGVRTAPREAEETSLQGKPKEAAEDSQGK